MTTAARRRPAPPSRGQGAAPPRPARPRCGPASSCSASRGRANRPSRPDLSRPVPSPRAPQPRRTTAPRRAPISATFITLPSPAPSTSERGAGTGIARRLLPAGGAGGDTELATARLPALPRRRGAPPPRCAGGVRPRLRAARVVDTGEPGAGPRPEGSSRQPRSGRHSERSRRPRGSPPCSRQRRTRKGRELAGRAAEGWLSRGLHPSEGRGAAHRPSAFPRLGAARPPRLGPSPGPWV